MFATAGGASGLGFYTNGEVARHVARAARETSERTEKRLF